MQKQEEGKMRNVKQRNVGWYSSLEPFGLSFESLLEVVPFIMWFPVFRKKKPRLGKLRKKLLQPKSLKNGKGHSQLMLKVPLRTRRKKIRVYFLTLWNTSRYEWLLGLTFWPVCYSLICLRNSWMCLLSCPISLKSRCCYPDDCVYFCFKTCGVSTQSTNKLFHCTTYTIASHCRSKSVCLWKI